MAANKPQQPNEIVEFVPSDPTAQGILDDFFLSEISVLAEKIDPEDFLIAGGKVLSLLMRESFKSKDWDLYCVDRGGFAPHNSIIRNQNERREYLKGLHEESKITIIKEHPGSVMLVIGKLFEDHSSTIPLNKPYVLIAPGKDDDPSDWVKTPLGDCNLIEIVDNACSSPTSLLQSFDLNVSRCAYSPAEGKFYVDEGLVDFLLGEDEPPEIVVHHDTKPLRTINRIAKYHDRGFPINSTDFKMFVRRVLSKTNLDKIQKDLDFFEEHGFEFSDNEESLARRVGSL